MQSLIYSQYIQSQPDMLFLNTIKKWEGRVGHDETYLHYSPLLHPLPSADIRDITVTSSTSSRERSSADMGPPARRRSLDTEVTPGRLPLLAITARKSPDRPRDVPKCLQI